MRKIISALIILIIVSAGAALGRRILSPRNSENAISDSTARNAVSARTPADDTIRKAEAFLKVSPAKPEGYNLLAAAFIQKARETGDFSFNARAEEAIRKSFEIAPQNQDAMNLQATLLVVYHRFSEAAETARRASRSYGENPDAYSALADSLVELGDYREAVAAAQKMMNLRPDGASYSRTSHIRALHGDTEGAAEAMMVAVKSAGARDSEPLAWCRVQLGNQLLNMGRLQEGEREFDAALTVLPDYHLGLAAKARARAIAEDYSAAIELYEKALKRVPLADTAIALGDLYTKTGRSDDARRKYEFAEFVEQAGQSGSDNPSRLAALLWADKGTKIAEALDRMRRERTTRSDIYTSDSLAWCLFKKGDLESARVSIEEALRLGTRDALIHYHAGMIYDAAGDRQKARRHLRLALSYRVSFDNAFSSFGPLHTDAAKRRLEEL